jgi:hypothetical protein
MGTRGGRAGAVGALAAAGALAVASCLGPTEVTLVLTTDVPCDTLQRQGTSITVGTASDIEAKDPVTITKLCDPGAGTNHNIGTFVVIPSGGSSDTFAVRIVSGVDVPVGDCKANGYHGCIIERRELAFVPHTPLTLPIPMDIDCLNVQCATNETCFKGGCVSSHIPNSSACASPGGCTPDVLPDAAAPAGDGAVESSRAGGPGADGALSDVLVDMSVDASVPEVTGQDTTIPEASTPDGTPQDVTTVETAPPDGAPGDATVADSQGGDALADGPVADGSGPDAVAGDARADVTVDSSGPDATPETGPDAPLDATSSDSGGAPDVGEPPGTPLGICPTVNTTHVACSTTTCGAGQVCCVGVQGGVPTEQCTSAAGCDTSFVGSVVYSSLACRNRGDCPSGYVCCMSGNAANSGVTTSCVTSCPQGPTLKAACANVCECSAGTCTTPQPYICNYLNIAVCGGTCP